MPKFVEVFPETHPDHRSLFGDETLVGSTWQRSRLSAWDTVGREEIGARVATAVTQAEGHSDVPPLASRGRPLGGGDPGNQYITSRRLLSPGIRTCSRTG